VAGNNGQTNRLYLNDGSGGFTTGAGTAIGSESDVTVSITLGDIDGDGDLDVVTGNYNQTNKLYLNDGSGGFTAGTGTSIGSESDSTQSIALGDIDGDGKLDIVAGNHSATNKLYLNDGSGGFTTGAGTTIGSESGVTTSIALGDIDGDGNLDIVAGNHSGTNKLYLNDGSGGFDTTGTVIGSESDGTFNIALGDIDGDGDLDVVAGNEGTNKLYLNDGSGGFPTSGTAIGSESDSSTSIALGDIGGDGDLDVVVGNSNQTNKLHLNNSSGGFTTGVGAGIGSDTDNTRSIVLADIDGDGDIDVVAGNFGQTNKLYLNNGGGFTASTDIGSDTDNTQSIALADIDSDGDIDVVAGNFYATNKLYLNNGSGGFTTGTGTDIGSDTGVTYDIALADIDGDGDTDVVAGDSNQTNKLYLNDGSGGFATGTDIGSNIANTYSIALADIDSDGDIDVVAGNYIQTNKLYLNDGSGGFAAGTGIGSDTDYTRSIALADIDSDGYIDVVVGNNGQANKLYLNDGSGGFTTGAGTDIGSDADNAFSIALVDIDGSGYIDVVVGNDGASNKLYLNDGSGGFTTGAGTDIGSDTDSTYAIALADIDGDGDIDVVAGNNGQANKLYTQISFAIHANAVYSNKVNGSQTVIAEATLTATEITNTATTRNTSIDYYVSNNGGDKWYGVKSGSSFTFPDEGTDDVRWRAQLNSLSPVVTPVLSNVELSYTASPKITGVAYNIFDGELTVTGVNFDAETGVVNDIDVSAFTFTGEASGSYTLTDTADVDIASSTEFTLTLSGTDKAEVDALINKNGTTSTDATVYNLVAAEDWNVGAKASLIIADSTTPITANNINEAPAISGAPAVTVAEDTSYSFVPTVTDVNTGDTKTFTITNQPSWAGFSTTTGELSGMPDNDDVGSTADIVITVTDSGGLSASLPALTITVTNTNDAPTISGTPTASIAQGASYSFTPTAADIDAGDTQTFSITNKPSWASFSTTTGELTGTPDNDDVGTTIGIVITVTDSAGASASLATFAIEVTAVDVATPTTPTTPAVADLSISAVATTPNNTSYDMSYDITLTNSGDEAAENVQVTTTIPEGVVLSVIPDNCELAGTLLTCTIASVAAGETVTITLSLVGSENVDGAIVTGIVGADAGSEVGNVSTTFDSVFEEVTVEVKSSGGSMPIMGLFGCLILLLIRKVKLKSKSTLAPMKKLMAAVLVLFATGAQAAEAQSQSVQMSDLTINVSLGSASSEVSNKSAEQGLANNSQEQNGISTDGSRFAYHIEVGKQVAKDWRILAGYMDLGPATLTFNGVTSSADDLVDALSELDMVSGKGLTASVEYKYQLNQWYLAPQAGLFSWHGQIGVEISGESYTFKQSDTSLLYGLTLGYQFNDKARFGLRWLKTSLGRDVNTVMLSVSYNL